MNGEIRAISAKRLKNLSSTPKTSDGRKMVALGNAATTACSAFPLVEPYWLGLFGSAPMADIWISRWTPLAAPSRPIRSAPSVCTARNERRSAFRQRANEVNDDLGPDHGTMHRALAHHRGIKRHDLPYRTHRLEKQRRLRVAHRHPHDIALLGQSLDHIAADEAGTAEHRRHAPYRHGRAVSLSAPV